MSQRTATVGATLAARTPPHSVEAEQSVLGGLLIDNATWFGLADLLGGPCAFFLREHQLIFGVIGALLRDDKPADVITVFERLHARALDEAAGGLAYLNDLVQSVPSAANIRHYAEIVSDRAKLRAQVAAADRIRSAAYEAPDAARALTLTQQIVADLQAAASPPPSAYKLLSSADLLGMPPQRWRIHSVLPQEGFAAIFGASGSAKSFLVVHIIAAVAEGADCFGHRTKPARVVYVVLEGKAGIPQRIKAWEEDAGRKFPDGVQFVFESFKLTERDHVVGLAAAIDAAGGAEMIVIDTLNRAAPSADENSSHDMGLVLEAVKELQAMTGGLVVLVHHSGKDSSKGMRGHSSVHAGLDAAIEVTRTGDRREWTVHKAKDGQDGEVHPFRLRVVDLGEDEDGEPITSCVVAGATSTAGEEGDTGHRLARLPKGGNQRIVYDALGPLFRASLAYGRAGAPATRPCLMLEEAIDGTRERLAVEPRRRGERARQAITGLIATGVLGSNEGWLWLK